MRFQLSRITGNWRKLLGIVAVIIFFAWLFFMLFGPFGIVIFIALVGLKAVGIWERIEQSKPNNG